MPRRYNLAWFLSSAATFFVTALASSWVLFITKKWFGAGDLHGFAHWTMILSIGVGIVVTSIARLTARWNSFLAYSFAIVLGAVLADFGDHVVFRMICTWRQAFGFRAFSCWLPAGVIASVVVTRLSRRPRSGSVSTRRTSSIGVTIIHCSIVVIVAAFGVVFDRWKWEADGQWMMNELGSPKRPAELEPSEHVLFQDAGARISAIRKNHDQPTLDAARAAIDKFTQDAPKKSEYIGVLEQSYLLALIEVDHAAAEARVEKLLASPNPKFVEIARAWKRNWAAARTPIDMKFTAIDGREVDLAKLRGKVVLLDFWATWCGPCIEEMPNVVATYNRHHGEGFEVIGVSLDFENRRDNVLRFTKSGRMPWPQYYDEKGWPNKWATAFAITTIPSAWLINQEGLVVDRDARGEKLEADVRRLLSR